MRTVSQTKQYQATLASSTSPVDVEDKTVSQSRIRELIEAGRYQEAYKQFPEFTHNDEQRNDRAVCLLRMHDFASSILELRKLVLDKSGVWSRTDLPGYMKVNFATALFFGGHPSGAADVLTEVHCESENSALPLLQAIKQWKSRMNWLQRLGWNLANVLPTVKPEVPAQPLGTFSWEWK